MVGARAMKDAHKLVTEVGSRFSLPEVYSDIATLVRDPKATIANYVETIGHDSSLAMCLIYMANTSFFGFSRQVTNLRQAISVLGAIQLHDLVLCGLAIRAFESIPAAIVNRRQFWTDSVCAGIFTKLLAQSMMMPASNRFFTLGLLHEIGHLLMAAVEPVSSEQIIIDSIEQQCSPEELQLKRWGYTYADVSAEMLQYWELPSYYADVIRLHTDLSRDSDYKKEAAIINTGHFLLSNPCFFSEQPVNEVHLQECVGIQVLRINPQVIVGLIDSTRQHYPSVASCLLPARFVDEEPSVEGR